jgi:hypothetical protein
MEALIAPANRIYLASIMEGFEVCISLITVIRRPIYALLVVSKVSIQSVKTAPSSTFLSTSILISDVHGIASCSTTA